MDESGEDSQGKDWDLVQLVAARCPAQDEQASEKREMLAQLD